MKTSTINPTILPLTPHYPFNPHDATQEESPPSALLISALSLQKHIEGGYFSEIDRDARTVVNPFLGEGDGGTGNKTGEVKQTTALPFSGNNALRNASTSIYYYLSRVRPQGYFHRNKGRTVHTLIGGRGRYVLIHADEGTEGKKRVETFVVGKNIEKGEKMVWVVEGGKFKASFLIEGGEDGEGEGLLISETVVPGFEYADHDFLRRSHFEELVTGEQARELGWLVREGGDVDVGEL